MRQTRRAPAAGEHPKKPETKAEPATEEEKPSVTHHKITVHGRSIEYTGTAARMPIRNNQAQLEAQMFYVAYTVDDGGPQRPLTFAFNGGPGSATIWLHMGAFGLKRVKLDPNGFMPAAAVHVGRQSEHPAGPERPGIRGCNWNGIQPRNDSGIRQEILERERRY